MLQAYLKISEALRQTLPAAAGAPNLCLHEVIECFMSSHKSIVNYEV